MRAAGRPLTDGPGLHRLSVVLAATVALTALVVMAGWMFHVDALVTLLPGLASMKWNTAVSLLALSLGLVARPVALSWAAVALAAALAAATLLEYAAGVDLRLDQLVVADTVSGGAETPGRMAVATAACLLALAAAQAALLSGRGRPAQWLAGGAFLVAGVAVLGYLYGVQALYSVVAYSTMALNTAIAVLLLAVAILARVPGGLLSWAATGDGSGAAVLRRLSPLFLLVLPALGALRQYGEAAGLYDARFGLALLVGVSCLVLATAVYATARRLEVVDVARREAQGELGALVSSLREGRDAEWRRAEQLTRDLEEERERFDRAIGKLDDFVWTVEVVDDTTRLVFSSSNGAGLFGGDLPAGAPVAESIVALVHPDDLPVLAAFRARVLRGDPAEAELRLRGLDGEVRWVWLRGAPRSEGERLFYDGIATNVTARHELDEDRQRLFEQEQQQRQRLEDLDRAKNEFLAVAGHELRTPVAVVRGYTELLLATGALDEDSRRKLQVLDRRSEELQVLVNELFDLARLRAGGVGLQRTDLDVDRLVTGVVEAHDAAGREHGLELEVHPGGARAYADPVRLRQVVTNLLTNAIKYSPGGGRVTVRTLALPEGAGIEVSDTGMGVEEDEIPLLFDRFYRSITARETSIPGTGLGLAITRALVEAHGGTISARRNAGGGMLFTLTIPSAEPAGSPVRS